MEVKANVQKRRQDRIRELQSRPGATRTGKAAGGFADPKEPVPELETAREREREQLLYVRGSLDYTHGGDPEAAWKEREKELLRQLDRPDDETNGSYGGQGSRRDYGSYRGGGPLRRLLAVKTVAALLLFGAAWAMFHTDHPLAQKGKRLITAALTEEMDFGRVAAWYDKTFSGSPSLLPAFGSKQEATKVQASVAASRFVRPVKGKVSGAFTESGQGVWLDTKPDAHIAAMDEGRIEYAGERADTGHTVIIQHAGGLRTTYGGLKPTKWEAGDWVKAGDVIGTAGGEASGGRGSVFIAVMLDQRYVNPSDVVAFD